MKLWITAVAVLATTAATAAHAQPFDHLKCFKIKDLAPKVKYHADLTPDQVQFLAQTGCELKVPAKVLCVDVEKSNVVPAPPLAVNGPNARDFLCYNLKCPKVDPVTVQLDDQFGSRTITAKKPFQLCAPAYETGFPEATPTPCLPPPTPQTTATPAPACNDLIQNGGETDVDCGGPCPPCMLGDGCLTDPDCQSGFCTAGVCTVCSPGQMQACGTMLPGLCALGTRTCQGNGTWGACVGPSPQPETCNNVDDDCDGTVDNVVCPTVPNANGTCNGVTCVYSCNVGYSDCNGNPTLDGCEVNVTSDPNNCGACGLVCPGGGSCVGGVCKLPIGSACGFAAQCLSNNCVDGVCCNTACSGVCQACVASQTGATNGTCANITAGTDPANECPGAQSCDGAGACL